MRKTWDAVFIGGGAAGLAGAIMLKRLCGDASVLIVEKAPRVGKKLLSTGNGTCNFSNRDATAVHYHGAHPAFPAAALTAFPPSDAAAFFASVGVESEVRANGRMYPLCASASAVLDCLRAECTACGVEILCDTAVTAIKPQNGGFLLNTTNEPIETSCVAVTAGGAASPSLGGCGDGYALLTALGYKKTPIFPSIVQVRTDTEFVRAVKGLRVDGTVSFCLDGAPVASETGEILFTEYGISGPAVMQVSRAAGDWERTKKGVLTAHIDLLPSISAETLAKKIEGRKNQFKNRPLEDFLTGLLHKRIGQTVLRAVKATPLTRLTGTLTDEECAAIASGIKDWKLTVTGTQGFGGAQVTAGGIDTADFEPYTMESKKHPGLFAAGEVLDVDGDCGGFNLHFAWASACAAASAMSARLSERNKP